MTDNPKTSDFDDKRENLPPTLQAHLRALYTPPPFPPERDAQILARFQRQPRRFAIPAAIAAALLLSTGLTLFILSRQNPASAPALAYTRTGDIRDAFYLDRQLHAHASVPNSWDINHDGIVDDKDVHSLALAAVQLPQTDRGAQ